MGFKPISIKEYAKIHVECNPGDKESEITAQLQRALQQYREGVRCHCGEPIWVIGASQVGAMCFTCITREAFPESDYEILEACGKRRAPSPQTADRSPGTRTVAIAEDDRDREVPF
jgi:hypothetical protein